MTMTAPDPIADLLARVARDHRLHKGPLPELIRCQCGWRPVGMDEYDHREHLAEAQAAALRGAGYVAEGSERVEWGVRRPNGNVFTTRTRKAAVEIAKELDHRAVRRTFTTYEPVVGPWEVVGDE